jgi:F0F1-type ATP synthase membrane subunit b/b'
MDPFFTTFLILNALIVGVVATLAVQHAFAHYRPAEEKKSEVQSLPKMLPDMKKKLLEEAEEKFRQQIVTATTGLQKDIEKTTAELSTHVTKIGGEIISTEMQRYRESLEALRRQTDQIIKQAQAGVSQHQTDLGNRIDELRGELEKKLQADIDAEKEHMIAQIDTKITDAVTAFLSETLQHNVDLGSQTNYIIGMLEEHKDTIAQEIRQ